MIRKLGMAGWCGAIAGLWMLGAAGAGAAPASFDFKDAKGVNTVTFTLDAPLEAITGTANGVSGSIRFDPANPGATRGKIVVETSSMKVPNGVMQEHMLAKDWMDAAGHPQLTFEVESLDSVKTAGDVTTAEATGKLSLRGVTRTVKVPVKLSYLKDKLGARTNGQVQGDLLVVRATFPILRSEFGINPKAPQDKVADEVQLTLSLAGAAPRS